MCCLANRIALSKGIAGSRRPDEDALATGDLRIVDESGEDYLFPATAFVAISLPERLRSSLWRTAS